MYATVSYSSTDNATSVYVPENTSVLKEVQVQLGGIPYSSKSTPNSISIYSVKTCLIYFLLSRPLPHAWLLHNFSALPLLFLYSKNKKSLKYLTRQVEFVRRVSDLKHWLCFSTTPIWSVYFQHFVFFFFRFLVSAVFFLIISIPMQCKKLFYYL